MRTLLILVFISCAGLINAFTQTVKPSQMPDGWLAFRTPTEPELQCGNYSQREWKVTLDAQRLNIRLDTRRDHQDLLPSAIKSKRVAVRAGEERHVIRVSDGWLIGINLGEFGGGLWWFDSGGKRSKKLSNDNVVGFASTSNGVLVLAGLAHLSLDEGKVLRVTEGANGNRKVEPLVDLGSAPDTFAMESTGAMLVLTRAGLVRVNTTGKTEQLMKTNYQLLYPNSMTLSGSGVISIGMRHFVTRLTPTGSTYQEEWFVPVDCPTFAVRDLDCVCASARVRSFR
jgi:hypothetical protein